jgi:ribonuclease J
MRDKKQNREKNRLRVIPLGGLNEIGKNMTLLESGDDMMIIDCGLSFPDDEMFGIDIVIPDFSYLKENRNKIRGIIITHGHEDHIGSTPYLLKELSVPIYATRLPLALIKSKLEEHGLSGKLNAIEAGSKIRLGAFKVEAIRTTHSIVDSICLSIDTPAGRVFHTGDFKVDYTPVDGEPIDFARLAELGKKGVMFMMSDSTNATRTGYTSSEKTVGQALENIFRRSKSRIPSGTLVDINKIKNMPDRELVIITTGSQGEPMSALTRMAAADHRAVQIKKGDMIILSSTPIPGNEKTVSDVVNKLIQKGAEVIYSDIADTHVSGHACSEELKLMLSLIKPKYFMPVHGEYRHLKAHADIAESMGIKNENIFILENGNIMEITEKSAYIKKEKIEADAVMVDGLGVGDVGNIVLRDRRLLSESGLIIVVASVNRSTRQVVAGPDIISRGFVYVRENEHLIDQATEVVTKTLNNCFDKNKKDWNEMKSAVRDDLRKFIYEKTKRNPVILPIFMEV